MAIEIKVPVLPESVADATIATWHKKPGDTVKRDENIVDIETDKVMLEVPAQADGVLQEILAPVGTVVKAQEIIGRMQEGGAATAKSEKSEAAAPAAKTAETKTASTKAAEPALSPSVRRIAAEHDVDASKISGTGKDGRVTKGDVQSFLQSGGQSSAAAMSARTDQRVPMSRLRARIAERLLSAQHDAAILTTFNEVNLAEVSELRSRYKDTFEKKFGVRLGFMSFFTKAAVEALKRFPAVNASIDGNDIVYHNYYDIGIAVSTERGLVVPILRDVDQMSFADIERAIAEYGRKARDNQITIEEMTGGTFTITNGGVFGSLLSTPILNPPQSGILGMHKIEERPVVEKGQIVIRPMMYIALSYDHRIIDGKDSVQFLATIKQLLEDPARLILDV